MDNDSAMTFSTIKRDNRLCKDSKGLSLITTDRRSSNVDERKSDICVVCTYKFEKVPILARL